MATSLSHDVMTCNGNGYPIPEQPEDTEVSIHRFKHAESLSLDNASFKLEIPLASAAWSDGTRLPLPHETAACRFEGQGELQQW